LDGRPEARNLINIYASLAERSVDQVLAEVGGKQFGEFKPMLGDLAVSKLSPISTEMARLMDDPAEIDRVLAKGALQAREITAPILQKTYDIVGMVRPAV
jgi:tryptophanyl-tRNA synthetase